MTNGTTFVGIMAADIRVASVERALFPWLAQAGGTCTLLSTWRAYRVGVRNRQAACTPRLVSMCASMIVNA